MANGKIAFIWSINDLLFSTNLVQPKSVIDLFYGISICNQQKGPLELL